MSGGRLAVALHDVRPGTLDRCALVRDWLDDLGVPVVTLVVTSRGPAREAPALEAWLRERLVAGDAVVAHGSVPASERRTLRLDLHPADFEDPRRVRALERVLRRAQDRAALAS